MSILIHRAGFMSIARYEFYDNIGSMYELCSYYDSGFIMNELCSYISYMTFIMIPTICLVTDFIWMCNHDVCECGHHTPTPVMDFAPCGPSWTEEIDAWSRLWILSYKSSGKYCKTQRQYHSVKRGVLSNLFLRYPLKKNA